MLTTKRNPSTVGEIPTQEFMEPLGLTQGAPADAVGVQRKHVNEWCNGRRNVTAATRAHACPGFWQNSGVLAEYSASQ
jgi:addiction module HigA family antidote